MRFSRRREFVINRTEGCRLTISLKVVHTLYVSLQALCPHYEKSLVLIQKLRTLNRRKHQHLCV